MFSRLTNTGLQAILDILKNVSNSILLISNDNLQIDKTIGYADIEDYILQTSDITNSTSYGDRYIKFDGIIDSTINQIITHVALAFIQQNTKKLISIMKINPTYVLNVPQNITYILDINTIQPIIDARSHFWDQCIIDYKILNYNEDFKYIVDGTSTKDLFKVKYEDITSPYQINIKVNNVNFDATTAYVESGINPPSTYISDDNTNRITISTNSYSSYGPIYFLSWNNDKKVVHVLISSDITDTYEAQWEGYLYKFYNVEAFIKPNRNYKIISRIHFPNTQSKDTTLDYSSTDFPDYNIIRVNHTYKVTNLYTVLYNQANNYLIIGEVGSNQSQFQDGIFIYKKSNDGKNQVLNQPKIMGLTSNSRLGCSLDYYYNQDTSEDLLAAGEYYSHESGIYRAGAVKIFRNNLDGTYEQIARIDGTSSYEYFGKYVKFGWLEDEVSLFVISDNKAYVYTFYNNQWSLFQNSGSISNLEMGYMGDYYIILKTTSSILVYKYANYSYTLDMSIDISSISNQIGACQNDTNSNMFISYYDYNNNYVKIKPIKIYFQDSTYEFINDIHLTDMNIYNTYMGSSDGINKLIVFNNNLIKIIDTNNYNIESTIPGFGYLDTVEKYQISIYQRTIPPDALRYHIFIPWNKHVIECLYDIFYPI